MARKSRPLPTPELAIGFTPMELRVVDAVLRQQLMQSQLVRMTIQDPRRSAVAEPFEEILQAIIAKLAT